MPRINYGEDVDEFDNERTSEDFKHLCTEELRLYEEKKHDYVGKGDPFGNFNRLANIMQNYPELNPGHPLFFVATGILKHLDCILDSLANNRVPEEDFHSRFSDISVFSKLGIVMLDTYPEIFPVEVSADSENAEYINEKSVHTFEGEQHREEDDVSNNEYNEGGNDNQDGDDEEDEEDEEEENRIYHKVNLQEKEGEGYDESDYDDDDNEDEEEE